MGSLSKRIAKKAKRFTDALDAINKVVEENKKTTSLPQSFDLASVAEADLKKEQDQHRQKKNKNKAKRRELKK